jgi:hypothetical protein
LPSSFTFASFGGPSSISSVLVIDFQELSQNSAPPSLLRAMADKLLCLKILDSVLLHPPLLPFELRQINALNFVFQYFNQPKDSAFWTLTYGFYLFSHMLSHVLHYQPFGSIMLPGFP